MEKLNQLIAEAVIKNVEVSGLAGSGYSVIDLMHNTNLTTLKKLYTNIKTQEDKLGVHSLDESPNTRQLNKLQFQSELIKEVYTYRKNTEEAALKKAEVRKANVEKLAIAKTIKDARELTKLQNMSDEDFEKEIARLEAEI